MGACRQSARVHIEGLEDRASLCDLLAFIRQQAAVKRLVAVIATPPTGYGIAISLRVPFPDVVELRWRDYRVRATGFDGQLFLACRKLTDVPPLPPP